MKFCVSGSDPNPKGSSTMKIEQRMWTKTAGWSPDRPWELTDSAQLVLVFGATQVLQDNEHFHRIRKAYPNAHILGCSTAGEIYDTQVLDDSLVVTAVQFEHIQLKTAHVKLSNVNGSYEAGERLASSLDTAGLVHVFVI